MFRTDRQRRSGRVVRFVAAFVAFTLLFAALSFFYLMRQLDWDFANFWERGTPNPPDSSGDGISESLSGSAVFLLGCSAGKAENLTLLALVKVDLSQKALLLCTVSPEERGNSGGQNLSFQSHYKNGGVLQLQEAVEQSYALRVDRYLLADESGFKTIINQFRGLRLTVPALIDYNIEGLRLYLMKGAQTLGGDALLRYLQYQSLRGAEGLAAQAEVLRAMLEQYLTAANVEKGDAAGNRLFETAVNALDCNVSVLDFAVNQKALRYLTDPKACFTVQIVATPADFGE